jgi:hypothetical protein
MVHGLKEKEKGEAKEMGRLEEKRGRGEGKRDFLLKLFSNHFVKISKFTQTRNHAFKS